MIRVNVSLANASVTETETLTAGRVGLECGFTFSSEWDDLLKVAVFEGEQTIEVALGTASVAVVPPECMATAGYNLRIGVYGLSPSNSIVIPTVWAKAGKIKDSASPDEESFAPATPELVAQIMSASETALSLARGVADAAEAGEFDGADGFSPAASVTRGNGVTTIEITDENGTTTAQVYDGEPGTTDYEDMANKPSINGVTLQGNKTAAQLGLVAAQQGAGLITAAERQQIQDNADDISAIEAKIPNQASAQNQLADKNFVNSAINSSTEIFWATYGTTTNAEIEAAYQAGKEILCLHSNGTVLQLANRASATKHLFGALYPSGGVYVYLVACENDTWSGYARTLVSTMQASSSTPAALGTGAAGSSADYSRADHVHPMPSASDVGAGTYSKPSGGIPASDLAAGVIPTVPTKTSDLTNDSGFLTLATLPVYNGGVT